MSHRVSLYGLCVELPVAMAGTVDVASQVPTDVTVRFTALPADVGRDAGTREVYRSPARDVGEPVLVAHRGSDGATWLHFAEGARFWIAATGRDVRAEWDAPLTEADVLTFLAGPVMGVVLRRFGAIAVHASAVVLGGGAWAVVGASGTGKSTIAAAFAEDGDPVLSEDLLALRALGDEWMASPGHHEVRLWEESVGLLLGDREVLPALTPTWPKRAFDLGRRGLPRATAPVPLRGLLVLGARRAPGDLPAREALTSSEALHELLAHAYANHLLSSAELARELVALGAIAGRVPAWRVRPGAGAGGLKATVSLMRALATDAADEGTTR